MMKFLLGVALVLASLGANSASSQEGALDQEIKRLQEQIKEMGATPDTQRTYPKEYDDYLKGTKPSKKAKKIKGYKIAHEKSGFFMGGGYALGLLTESYSSPQVMDSNLEIKVPNDVFKGAVALQGWANMLNLELGYQRFFNPYFGTRLYGDLLFEPGLGKLTSKNNPKAKGEQFFYALGSLDMDALFDAPLDRQRKNFLGGYLGFGVGLMLLNDKGRGVLQQMLQNGYVSANALWKMLMQVDYTINVGIAFTYKRHWRFELGTKIPITYLRLGFETPATYSNTQGSRTLISGNTGFKRSSFLVMNVLYVF